ncbi:MAG TPA: heparinase II/III family protein [Terriglobia bacterium]|nr:heparinase II/III family protein [Terriglobia bacterium]
MPAFSRAAQSGASAQSYASWTWTTDFSHGIRDWLNYPLAQDIGFDPGLYTANLNGTQCLVREVKSYGQETLRIGLIKPLSFRATRESQFNLTFQLKISGSVEAVTFMLAGENGRLYKAPLLRVSRTRVNTITIRGMNLGVPAAGASVQAILIEATVKSPALDSSSRLVLRHLGIVAERRSALALLKPQLAHSAGEELPVAEHPVEAGGHLTVEVRSLAALRISVYDSHGKEVPLKGKRVERSGQEANYQVSIPPELQPGLYRAVVNSGGAGNEFQFLVLGDVPAHPRVLLTLRRIEELRSMSASSPFLAALTAKARTLRSRLSYNSFAGENISLMPSVSVFPGLPQYFSLLENYSNAIAFNAVEYRLDGDQAALSAARKGLLTISNWPTWTPPWFKAHGLHTYYEVGVVSQRLAVGYDLIADQLSLAEREEITGGLWRNAINPTVEEYFTNNRMPIAASNWMANSVGGALAAVVALYGDLPNWNARMGTALSELTVAYDRLLNGLFPGDGSEAEPAGYQEFAMEGISFGMAALHSLGVRPPGAAKVFQSFWWPRYAEVSPALVLDTGDFGGQLRALSGFAWEAEHSNNASLRAFYDTAEVGSLLGVAKLHATGRTLEAVPGLLDLTCCSRTAAPAPIPPPSRIFPDRGSAVLRSGWKPTDTVISIRVGPWFNHEHHDQGTFQVAAFGQELIGEAGYADYYKDPNYQTYFKQAPGHNTILIDGNPFSQPGEEGRYWKALAHYPYFTAHLLSPAVDYLSADLTRAYGGVLTDFQREFIFLKPDVLIIRDQLQSPLPHRFDWLLHVPLGDKTGIRGANAAIAADNASATITSIEPNNRWTLQKTPLAGDRYTDLDRVRLSQPYEFVLDSNKSANASFLVGMKFGGTGQPLRELIPREEGGQEGFTDASGGWSWIAGREPGTLERGGISAQGESLGVNRSSGSLQIFGTGITSLRGNKDFSLESTMPVDLCLISADRDETITFFNQRNTTLKVTLPRRPATVLLDNRVVHTAIEKSPFVLKGIGPGEHIFRIHY